MTGPLHHPFTVYLQATLKGHFYRSFTERPHSIQIITSPSVHVEPTINPLIPVLVHETIASLLMLQKE